jgi:hypothetical protein
MRGAYVLMPENQFKRLSGRLMLLFGRPMEALVMEQEVSARAGEFLWFAVALLLMVVLKCAEPLF